jgi:hypothetical protein
MEELDALALYPFPAHVAAPPALTVTRPGHVSTIVWRVHRDSMTITAAASTHVPMQQARQNR